MYRIIYFADVYLFCGVKIPSSVDFPKFCHNLCADKYVDLNMFDTY